jgi:hypothetical protein
VICPSGNFAESLSSPFSKNNSLRRSVEAALLIPPFRAHKRAYRDRHGRWARDAVDAFGAQDECANSGRRSRGVLISRRWYQLATMLRIARGWWQESPITRETTK